MPTARMRFLVRVALALTMPWPSQGARAQPASGAPAHPESATVAASDRYRVPTVYQWLAGRTYRDLWTTPIRVPVLDLAHYAGGLHLTKSGGGMQTRSLRFESEDGVEYVFRLSEKRVNYKAELFNGTPVGWVMQDQVSAMHPAAAMMSAQILAAAGVLHPTATFMVLPDDTLLGKYREEFAGHLGMLEEYPNVPKGRLGFGNAVAIIDSDSLLTRMNADPRERIDARAFLTARLTDMLIGDNDRHAGNWKWARFAAQPDGPWVPIPRDRDHAFVSFDGVVIQLSRLWTPMLLEFGAMPAVRGLTMPWQIDARVLAELDQPVWDSVARALTQRVTDGAIHDAVYAVPEEFQSRAPNIEALLRRRRDALPAVASRFYGMLAKRVEVHGTDAVDHATAVRMPDGSVDIQLQSGGVTSYHRLFSPAVTSEVLVYLHNGNDGAVITGRARKNITLRIVGGNGTNTMIDSSFVGADDHPTHLYDTGTVDGVSYEMDTIFDRRPWERERGKLLPPRADHGARIAPVGGLSDHRGTGLTPRLALVRYGYGFRQRPYSSMIKLEGEYAMEYRGARVGLTIDKRREESRLHFTTFARMSQFEMLRFQGLGNAIGDAAVGTFADVHQTQWLLRPALALSMGTRADVSLGPVIQHVTTDTSRSPYLAATMPYGAKALTQVGVQFAAKYEWKSSPTKDEHTHHHLIVDFTERYVPAALDVRRAFVVSALTVGTTITIPAPTEPILVIRAGARRVDGDFPFYEAAMIGGGGTTRYMDPQRYAGDASVYATSELRIPLARFHLFLPVRLGVLGLAEAGRVYNNGESPGGWHPRAGGGLWVGRGNASPVITLTRTTEPGHSGLALRLGLNF